VRSASNGTESVDRDGQGARCRHRRRRTPRPAAGPTPYYALAAPKSTGRETFHAGYLDEVTAGRHVSTPDLLATLTELTALTVADALRPFGIG
jgi:anhydro-N-acetylmuramic acid kinase